VNSALALPGVTATSSSGAIGCAARSSLVEPDLDGREREADERGVAVEEGAAGGTPGPVEPRGIVQRCGARAW
jgi:hypothetical protein